MADANSFILSASSWLPSGEWANAPESLRRRYLVRVGELAVQRKRSEQRRKLDARGEGRKLLPRLRPRQDRATGPPLSPHRQNSRTMKWVRSSVGLVRGEVTVWWSHGWGRILGYHRAGIPSHLGSRERDVIGLTERGEDWVKAQARSFWRSLRGQSLSGSLRSVKIASLLPRP